MGRPAPRGGSQDASFAPERVLEHADRLNLGGVHLRVVHTPATLRTTCATAGRNRHAVHGRPRDAGIHGGDQSTGRRYARLPRVAGGTAAFRGEDLRPGHGYLIGAPHREVRRLIAHRLARETKVTAALQRRGPATLEELVTDVYDEVSPALHPVAMRSLTRTWISWSPKDGPGRHPDAIYYRRKERAMSNEPTMKLVTNLDRTAIEAKAPRNRGEAAAAGLTDLARCSSHSRACRAPADRAARQQRHQVAGRQAPAREAGLPAGPRRDEPEEPEVAPAVAGPLP